MEASNREAHNDPENSFAEPKAIENSANVPVIQTESDSLVT